MRTYKERTNDKGIAIHCNASDNQATYILTSAHARDLYREYLEKYDRIPTSGWYNRHFTFDRL